MFVDSLSSDEVVVPATESPEIEERRKESKLQKSLRNQRNRLLNKMKREREIQEDLQKYLPVHLRNLPEPKKGGKRGSEQPSSTTEESSSPSVHDKPHYHQDDRRGRKNMNNSNKRPMSRDEGSYDRRDDRSNKRPRISSAPSSSSSVPSSTAAPVVVDSKLVVTGKDWQASGIHPSWAAKQMKQSQLSIKIDAAPSQAKKIVFDDD